MRTVEKPQKMTTKHNPKFKKRIVTLTKTPFLDKHETEKKRNDNGKEKKKTSGKIHRAWLKLA